MTVQIFLFFFQYSQNMFYTLCELSTLSHSWLVAFKFYKLKKMNPQRRKNIKNWLIDWWSYHSMCINSCGNLRLAVEFTEISTLYNIWQCMYNVFIFDLYMVLLFSIFLIGINIFYICKSNSIKYWFAFLFFFTKILVFLKLRVEKYFCPVSIFQNESLSLWSLVGRKSIFLSRSWEKMLNKIS